ncbi:MAG: YciI family protein [Gemmatimonadota bacterium]
MKYLCLIYSDETSWGRMSREEAGAMMGKYMACTEYLKAGGHYLGGNGLQPTSTATTVRVRNGAISTTDGPFVETKEQLGGYYLVEARDLNEAIQLASHIPAAEEGGIEIRPVMDTSGG